MRKAPDASSIKKLADSPLARAKMQNFGSKRRLKASEIHYRPINKLKSGLTPLVRHSKMTLRQLQEQMPRSLAIAAAGEKLTVPRSATFAFLLPSGQKGKQNFKV